MIHGRVDSKRTPTIEVEIAGRAWIAVLDTGFNGDLELPYALGEAVEPEYRGHAMSDLAAGVTVREDYYLVRFPFDGETVDALATFVAGEGILIGTRMLRNHRLEINFPAGTVLLERIR